MNRIIFLLLALFPFFSPQVWAFSQQDLVTLLQKPQTVRGDFSQQRYLKALKNPINASGEFGLISKKGLLWEMQTPFAGKMRVTPKGIAQWNGSAWVENDKIGQSQQIALFLGLLSGDIAALRTEFDTALIGTEQDWTLTLTPNSLIMKQIFSQIRIKGDRLVKEIELAETQGDRTLIRFSRLQADQPLPSSVISALQ